MLTDRRLFLTSAAAGAVVLGLCRVARLEQAFGLDDLAKLTA